MTTSKIVATWPDGSKQEARSATEFILKSASEQWSETSFAEMKAEMSKRARVLSGKYIHPAQNDEPFLLELCRVGLFDLEVDGEKVIPVVGKNHC